VTKFKFSQLSKNIKPFFIAEVGVNHEGSIFNAIKLIDAAVEGGANAVKFQTYKAEKIAVKNSPYYWNIKKESTKSQFDLFSKYDGFDFKQYKILSKYCKKRKVEFLSTPFDLDAVDFLNPLMNLFKISSSDITNFPLLEKISSKKKPIILSTGASSIKEIREAINIIKKNKIKKIILMHCILNYPTKNSDANLNMIKSLQREFPDCISGYSDHTMPSNYMQNLITAYLLGAKVIEKHFTLNKKKRGNDHYHSLNKKDLKLFNKKIDYITQTLGANKKFFLKSEIKSRRNARRSIVLNVDLIKGEKIQAKHLICKRPATGISPKYFKKVIGKKVKKNILSDTILKWNLVK
jgi:N-acetylneuraminate synthase